MAMHELKGNFSDVYDTWVLAHCPDVGEWFATNRRAFYYEYPKDFQTPDEAIEYFQNHYETFYWIERTMKLPPSSAYPDGVWLANTGERFDVSQNRTIFNVVIGRPLVSESDLLGSSLLDYLENELPHTIFTSERRLPVLLKELGAAKSTSEVRRNKPKYNITLDQPDCLWAEWGKRKLYIIVGTEENEEV